MLRLDVARLKRELAGRPHATAALLSEREMLRLATPSTNAHGAS